MLPSAPFFHFDEKGDVEISLNGAQFPSEEKIKRCIKALESLLEIPASEITQINYEVESNLVDSEFKIEKEPVAGFVYVYRQGIYYKIGRTKNIASRQKKYVTENPNGFQVVFEFPVDDYIQIESDLHQFFEHKRHRGEWFLLNDGDLEIIKNKYIDHE